MATTGRDQRREDRSARAVGLFGPTSAAALDALELMDLAWHDCYGETSPPEQVLEDVWVVSDGDLAQLVSAARLAVIDFRDLRLIANARRAAP